MTPDPGELLAALRRCEPEVTRRVDDWARVAYSELTALRAENAELRAAPTALATIEAQAAILRSVCVALGIEDPDHAPEKVCDLRAERDRLVAAMTDLAKDWREQASAEEACQRVAMTYIRPATVFHNNPTDGLGDEEVEK
jgi:hypothetical protein